MGHCRSRECSSAGRSVRSRRSFRIGLTSPGRSSYSAGTCSSRPPCWIAIDFPPRWRRSCRSDLFSWFPWRRFGFPVGSVAIESSFWEGFSPGKWTSQFLASWGPTAYCPAYPEYLDASQTSSECSSSLSSSSSDQKSNSLLRLSLSVWKTCWSSSRTPVLSALLRSPRPILPLKPSVWFIQRPSPSSPPTHAAAPLVQSGVGFA